MAPDLVEVIGSIRLDSKYITVTSIGNAVALEHGSIVDEEGAREKPVTGRITADFIVIFVKHLNRPIGVGSIDAAESTTPPALDVCRQLKDVEAKYRNKSPQGAVALRNVSHGNRSAHLGTVRFSGLLRVRDGTPRLEQSFIFGKITRLPLDFIARLPLGERVAGRPNFNITQSPTSLAVLRQRGFGLN